MPEVIRPARDEMSVEIDASSGLLTGERARTLADEGMGHYNHNIGALSRHLDEVVGIYDFEDRLVTLRQAKDAGVDLYAGVIFGINETLTDRTDVALELQKTGVRLLPVNVLNPIPGMPLGDTDHADITMMEFVKTVAVYRLFHPDARVRLAGGREVNLAPGERHLLLEADMDGVLIGDYLTTDGQSSTADIEVVEWTGLKPNHAVNGSDVDIIKRREARGS